MILHIFECGDFLAIVKNVNGSIIAELIDSRSEETKHVGFSCFTSYEDCVEQFKSQLNITLDKPWNDDKMTS